MSTDDWTAVEAIRRLKALYFYCLDHKDWEGWRRSVFVPDVRVSVPNTWDEPLLGLELFIDRVSTNTCGAVTIHHGHTPIIDLQGDEAATGIWAMEDVIHFSPANPMMGKYTYMHGYGHYHDRYVRTDEGWRIAAMELRRLHLERR
jgi:hypothetical protein